MAAGRIPDCRLMQLLFSSSVCHAHPRKDDAVAVLAWRIDSGTVVPFHSRLSVRNAWDVTHIYVPFGARILWTHVDRTSIGIGIGIETVFVAVAPVARSYTLSLSPTDRIIVMVISDL